MSQMIILQTTPSIYNPSGNVNVTLSKPNAVDGELERVISSNKFQSWWDRVNRTEGKDYLISTIDIRDVNWFGKHLGFIKADCIVYSLINGEIGEKPIPGITFIRGGAIAILVKVKVIETSKSYFALTNQIRFPVGEYCLEIVAGTIDENTGNFSGDAAKELYEEIGMQINGDELEPLGRFYPSPGGCDEFIELYYYETEISKEDFYEEARAIYGTANKSIKIQFVPEKKFSSVLLEIGDAKAEIAYRRYLVAKRKERGQNCGYSTKTSRCGIKYVGTNPEYCTYNEDTSRCRIVDLKRKGRKL
jgi:hypothetical protein